MFFTFLLENCNVKAAVLAARSFLFNITLAIFAYLIANMEAKKVDISNCLYISRRSQFSALKVKKCDNEDQAKYNMRLVKNDNIASKKAIICSQQNAIDSQQKAII